MRRNDHFGWIDRVWIWIWTTHVTRRHVAGWWERCCWNQSSNIAPITSHVSACRMVLDGLGGVLPSHPDASVMLLGGWERCPITPRGLTGHAGRPIWPNHLLPKPIHMLNDITMNRYKQMQLYMYKRIPNWTQTTPNWTQRSLRTLLSTTNRSLSLILSLLGSPRCHLTVFDGWERVAPLKIRFRRFWVSRPKLLVFSTPGSDSSPQRRDLILSTFLSESSGKNDEKRPFWPNLTRRDNLDRPQRHSGDMTGRWWAKWSWTSSVRDIYCWTSWFDHIAPPEWPTREPRWSNTDVSTLVLVQRGHIRSFRESSLVVELI